MNYRLEFTPNALKHLEECAKTGQNKTLKKIKNLLAELRLHPDTGTGQVEQLRGNLSGYWSRRIDKKNRLIYKIENERIIVIVISMKGHY